MQYSYTSIPMTFISKLQLPQLHCFLHDQLSRLYGFHLQCLQDEHFPLHKQHICNDDLVAAYIYIVQFILVLRCELNCVKIPQGETNKSANRWGNLRAKGGVVLPSVFNLP
jgi:hypothetical protein